MLIISFLYRALKDDINMIHWQYAGSVVEFYP